jgi:phospholipid/cholesterol/gamma-HCH transport system substrate-binding protein
MKIEGTLTDLREVMKMFREDVPRYRKLAENADATLSSYKALADRAEGVLAANEEGINKAITGLDEMRRNVSALAVQATKLVEENRKDINEFTNTGLVELTNLAVDAQAAAEQIRRVMEEMERDPARFFLGRPAQVEVQ